MSIKSNTIRMNTVELKRLGSNKVVIVFLMVVALFILGGIISPGFLEFGHIMNVLSLSSFLGIIALAQTIVILSGNEGLDLSVGAVASLASVMAAKIMQGQNGNLMQAVIIVLFTGFVIGSISGIGISFFKVPALVMTLAMGSVVGGFSLVYTNGQPTGRASKFVVALGSGRLGPFPHILIIWIVVLLFTLAAFRKLKWGKKLYGVGANDVTAQLSGVRTRMLRMFAYSLAGMISALAGIFLLGYTETPYLDIGSVYILPSVAAVVIGGVSLVGGSGNYLGVVAGSIVLTTLNSILVSLRMGEGGRQIVYGLVILVVLSAYSIRKKN